ncbi:MAG TPA: hypothetical protein VE326_06105 [Candidatus Binatia bacterium]|nr:hypothetical protein [Candidatus Binatia bacterium]
MRATMEERKMARVLRVLLRTVIGAALAASVNAPPLSASPKHEAEERLERQPVKENTRVDHDGQPIPQPHVSDPSHLGHLVRESFVEPISHLFDIPDKVIWLMRPLGVRRVPEAPNVNAFDEVPNSTWFTNRNHVRALSTDAVREGPFGAVHPTPPYTIKSVKTHGFNPGFNMKDAAGKRWVVKLDRAGFPQISSGAGVVSSRLVWAAGYNISHDEAFTFRRDELSIDADLAKGKDGKKPFRDADLEALLTRGARTQDGRYYAIASFFLPGTPIGPFSFRGIRQDDPNDRFRHKERRDLRGLFVVYSWVNNWDVKDDQSLDTYGPDSANGHVTHYLLDVNGSLGAAAEGPKPLKYGYEQRFDTGRTLQRFVTLGFSTDPWRRAHQDSGIPSVGNFEAVEFDPADWAPLQYMEPFRRMTLADAYWGAKIVASFSNAQIAAAVDAAGYEDPRAPEYIERTLIARRDKIARFWFARVAPLDFFHVKDGYLVFHDLAVDLGLAPERGYEVEEEHGDGRAVPIEVLARDPQISLSRLGRGSDEISLRLSVAKSHARPVRVDLRRNGHDWVVTRVRHG